MQIRFEVQIRIQRPVAEVFDAVYDPEKLSGYFTNGGARGTLDAGATVQWAFEDTPGERVEFPVVVEESVHDERIVLRWQGTAPDEMNRVEMNFSPKDGDTVVKISESGWDSTDDDLKRSYSNCMGWSHMLAYLKAYLEYGIDLRKGAYGGLYKAGEKNTSA